MIQSWYIACDTHLFLTAPVIVGLLHRRPRLGRAVLALALAASVATAFAVTYAGRLDAFLLVHIRTLRDPIADKTFRDLYIPTHTRATPYYMGMITGLLRHRMKDHGRLRNINKVGVSRRVASLETSRPRSSGVLVRSAPPRPSALRDR